MKHFSISVIIVNKFVIAFYPICDDRTPIVPLDRFIKSKFFRILYLPYYTWYREDSVTSYLTSHIYIAEMFHQMRTMFHQETNVNCKHFTWSLQAIMVDKTLKKRPRSQIKLNIKITNFGRLKFYLTIKNSTKIIRIIFFVGQN